MRVTKEMQADIDLTCKNLHIQDNRITDQPMFLVQVKRRDTGYDSGYVDNFVWMDEDWDAVDEIPEDGDPDDYTKVYYKERWEFVTACFTEVACQDFIDRMKHRYSGEMRIYAESSYRNYEYQAVRNMLLDKIDGADNEGN